MSSTRDLINSYLQALATARFGDVPFASEAEFYSPMLDEPLRGSEALVAGLEQAAGGMVDVELVDLVVEGDRASARIHFTAAGTRVEVCDWFECRDGEIASVRAFYDPRPFL